MIYGIIVLALQSILPLRINSTLALVASFHEGIVLFDNSDVELVLIELCEIIVSLARIVIVVLVGQL